MPKKERPQNRNLKPFPKGVSGNPKGMKKGTISLTARLKTMLKENPDHIEAINNALIKKARRGHLGHTQLVFDRVDGPSKQKIAVEIYSEAFNDKQREELDDILTRNLTGHGD